MAILIEGTNCFDAWQQVCARIVNNGPQSNVLATIDNPTDFADLDDWIVNRSPSLIKPGVESVKHVIRTIMPYTLAAYFSQRSQFYDKYKQIYLSSKSRRWGTYFQRLISFDKHFNADGKNQLENAIKALNSGSLQRHYITFHLTSVHLDSNVQVMGATCWQFGEIVVNDNQSISLVAVYRSQDYFLKGLGNFIGLAKLLEFICTHTGRAPGSVIVHAIFAFSSASNKQLQKLIS